jgi:hypothetical protein
MLIDHQAFCRESPIAPTVWTDLPGDEGVLLFVLRTAFPEVAAGEALIELTGKPCADCLLPLAHSLAITAQL